MRKRDPKIIRVIAALLAVVMFIAQIGESVPAFYVHAEGEAEYSIEHKVNSSWDGGCNAEFILKNLSNTGTKDWSISFSTTDVITDIWGGTITECREVSDENTTTGLEHYYRYTVKAESYTASIPSGAQVNIGYSAVGDTHDIWDAEAELVFDDTEAGSGSNEEGDTTPIGGTYIGEGYTIDVIVADTWEGAYNVKLQIRNTSGEKIHNWGLMMKTSDKISGLYNAVEVSEKDGLRLIKNAGYDQDIPAGGSVEIGYTAFYDGKADVPKEFALSQVKKEADMSECVVSLFVTDEWEDGGMAQIIIENTSDSPIEDWSLEFDSTMDIANLWGGVIEKHEAGHYCIGNADYAQNIAAGEAWAITIVFSGKAADIKNIKVSQIVVGDGSLPDMPTPTPDEEEDIDLETDTDEDGIPDAYEEMIGTDPTMKDTDIDGLDDYVEVFVTGSDPLVYDSIEQGVADSDADLDGDGISNIDEITLGLDPSRRDTDHDGLDDDEEMYVYGTDPTDPDTDDDGLKDGDEIKLGLDPLNPATNGVSDAEYRISQTIDADSDVLRQINTDDNGYRFSADIKAAGYVEGNIKVVESDHAYVMQNDAMLGKALQLKYDMDNTVEKVTLHFEIDDQYVSGESTLYPDAEELRGIHRYNVFHYFEDRNMLLPVETFFDDEGNTVYAETDELGTYCLMDMEKIFDRLDSISDMGTDSVPEISQQAEIAEMQVTALEFEKEMSGIASNNIYVDDDIPVTKTVPEGDGRQLVNLYFILFRAGESDWIYEKERDLIPEVLEKLQENNNDYRFRAIVLFHDKCWDYYHAGLLKWYEDPDELKDMLMEMDYYSHYNGYVDYDDAGSILHGLLKEQIKDNPDSLNFAYNCTSTHMWCSRHISRPYSIYENFAGKVVYSDIGKYYFLYEDYDETSQYPTFVEKMGGVRWICEGDMVSKVYEHLIGSLPTVTEGGEGGDIPIPSGGEGGENGEDEPEDPKPDTRTEYPAITLTGWNIIKLAAPLTEGSTTDTDEDGITDWDEVDTKLITFKNGEYELPTINECINDVDKPYVKDGLKRFGESLSAGEDSLEDLIQHYKTARILPILSNPVCSDSDGDGVGDKQDIHPLYDEKLHMKFHEMIKLGVLNETDFITTNDGFSLSTVSIAELLKRYGYEDDSLSSFNTENGGMDYYFGCWYPFCICNEKGTEIGMIKSCSEVDEKTPKVSVPFIALDYTIFNQYSDSRAVFVNDELDHVSKCVVNEEYNDIILSYFESPYSEGLYTIGEFYVDCIVEEEMVNNRIPVINNRHYEMCSEAKNTLKKNKIRDNGIGIYNEEEDCIIIKDPCNLQISEKQCILSARSNNPSFNSFAAEIVFHAEWARFTWDCMQGSMNDQWGGILFILSCDKYIHFLKADLSVDDKKSVFEIPFKSPYGVYVKMQKSIWGDK